MDNDHLNIWTAIDRIAFENGLSVSGLAKRSGLDATAFNKSKRMYPTGKRRWPSTESVAKIVRAMHMSWPQFISYVDNPR
jgi:phage repressor protein C with HTH and peptisase S24 domain